MQSIAIEIGLDCRSLTPVNNVVSATCGRGGWRVFESPKASSAIRAGRGREKGEAHVSKRDMLTGGIADAPVCCHKQTVRPGGK